MEIKRTKAEELSLQITAIGAEVNVGIGTFIHGLAIAAAYAVQRAQEMNSEKNVEEIFIEVFKSRLYDFRQLDELIATVEGKK